MVEIIGAPFDLCGAAVGSRLGPAAVRMLGLVSALHELDVEVCADSDALEMLHESPTDYSTKVRHAVGAYRAVSDAVVASLERGNLPLVLGGDHSLSIGSISGALRHYGTENLAVLWIDAHMDLNTMSTSPSGNVHGMPVAALTRLSSGDRPTSRPTGSSWSLAARQSGWDAWQTILDEVVPSGGVRHDRTGWVGLRDVDSGEVSNYQKLQSSTAWTMHQIDDRGIAGVIDEIDAWLVRTGATRLWISFDVDSLDPLHAPGTGTAVYGGLTYREGHFLAERLHSLLNDPSRPYRLAGLDVVEVNPMTDEAGETAKIAKEWVCSLFGKRIMGALP